MSRAESSRRRAGRRFHRGDMANSTRWHPAKARCFTTKAIIVKALGRRSAAQPRTCEERDSTLTGRWMDGWNLQYAKHYDGRDGVDDDYLDDHPGYEKSFG